MTETLSQLKQTPMHSDIKQAFIERLTDIRNFVVADVQLTNGREIEFKPKPDKKEQEDALSTAEEHQ